MIVLVARQRQAVALDGVGDEAGRHFVPHRVEGAQDRLQIVAGQVRHQRLQPGVVVRVEQLRDAARVAEIARQLTPPGRAALIGQRGVERVGATVNPVAQGAAAGAGERALEQRAVLDRDDAPLHVREDAVQPLAHPVLGDGVEALAVVVDDPPDVADAVLPGLEQRLEHVALIELGVARQGDHPPGRRIVIEDAEALRPHVFLDQRGEARHRHPEPHRAGREVDVVRVLRP